MRSRIAALVALAVIGSLFPVARGLAQEVVNPLSPAARETEPVVLTGASLPEWATLGDVTAEAPSIDGARCQATKEGMPSNPITPSSECTHNQYEDPDFQTSDFVPPANATPVDRILGYKWTGDGFEQIPFQVDEMFTRYLSNNNSGFSFYSETDQHTTYAFDREGFRWTDSAGEGDDACVAAPASPVAKDPVQGLDTDDELVFMARDAGARADDAALPPGIEDSYEVEVRDPSNGGATSYVYLMKAAAEGPRAAYTADTGYVQYDREDDADVFRFSESNYESYGATYEGPWRDEEGVCHSDPSEWRQHRPGDEAWVTTPRYKFHYDGRWVMDALHVSENGDGSYGPDLIDQWKARAFQQRPGGSTPCCGYEEEVNNWGGSSILMGERSGPVRTIRETWGADSGTNVVRREIFYRDEIRFLTFLRVHVIPPGDGIYAQWDYNAGMITKYFNQYNEGGVDVDGKNDDVYGNSQLHAAEDGVAYDPDGSGPEEPVVVGNPGEDCPDKLHGSQPDCLDNDVDIPDPFFSGPNSGLSYEQVTGPYGTLVWRTSLKQVTPGGAAQTAFSVPYYRDDACFDDGTGSNPGPHMDPAAPDGDDPDDSTYVAPDGTRQPRKCWDSETDPVPPTDGDPRYYQGAIGTHGVHILLIADSDNAGTTAPLTEIDGEQRLVVLPSTMDNVGEEYGRGTEKPLVAIARPESRDRGGEVTPSPTSTSPTSTPSSTPSPSATPQKSATMLAFTDQHDTGAQYSDGATFQARLTDDTGALENEDVTFELTGDDGTTSWTATTNSDGVATVDTTITREPGPYQLVARYAGDDSTLASANQSSFAVDREDTDLTLAISGKGSKRTLVATLTDRDSGAGIGARSIQFAADGQSLGSSTTNGDGVATMPVKAGNRAFDARFEGDDYYVASSAQQRA